MPRADTNTILSRITTLAEEIDAFVPNDPKSAIFRGDLAGLLVVSIAATYESCVKEILINFASGHHPKFGAFAQNQFQRLNSRISVADLNGYANNFDPLINKKFKTLIDMRKSKINKRIGKDITQAYGQILGWRHEFAHTGKKSTTVEEALFTHRLAKWVLYSFDDAFG